MKAVGYRKNLPITEPESWHPLERHAAPLGALASGAVPRHGMTGFYAVFVEPWLTPFCFGAGVLTLALFAALAAVYLTVEAQEVALQEDFRRRALGVALAVFAAAGGTLALALLGAPLMGRGLTATPWALPLHMATAAAAVAAIGARWIRPLRATLVRSVAAAGEVRISAAAAVGWSRGDGSRTERSVWP
jgi:cytochrome d ubiquinol oxidase subunit II